MEKLNFACPWGYGDIKQSWSGTNYGLYSHLQNYYEVENVNTGIFHRGWKTFPFRVAMKLNRVLGGDDMDVFRMNVVNHFIHTDNTTLQFDECPAVYGDERHYIYQDLSVDYVLKMATSMPDVFAHSAYQHIQLSKIKARAKMQNAFYEKAAGIFSMGKWLVKELSEDKNIPVKDKVYHAGGGINVNTALLDNGDSRRGNKILFIGRDFKRKNGPLVVEAFRLLRQSRPEVELFIAGAEGLRLPDEGIHLLGNLPYSALPQYLNMCDVFCMPSKFEAYGLVFPEALTFGLPCIGRDAYEMPYFIEDGETGYLLKKETAEQLADLMDRALSNKQLAANVRERRDFYLEEYSWDTVARRIFDVIG